MYDQKVSVFYVDLRENILIVLRTVAMYIDPITTYSASYLVSIVYSIIFRIANV